MGTVNFRQPVISSSDMVSEGLQDWAEKSAYREWSPVEREERALRRRIRMAKQYADAYGVSYWPHYAFDAKCYQCDRQAMAAAEAVLAAKTGGRYGELREDGTRHHGGFDSKGHWGLDGGDIRKLWLVAGCKDTPKFRFMVGAAYDARPWGNLVFKKGDSLPFCINYRRGQRWYGNNLGELNRRLQQTGEGHNTPTLSRKALAALGRLSPALRWAAMDGVHYCGKVARIRDLNWAAVKAAQSAIAAGGDRVRASYLPNGGVVALLAGIKAEPLAHGGKSGIDRWASVLLCPQYAQKGHVLPHGTLLDASDARRIVRGETPQDVVGGGVLTAKEAHLWLLSGEDKTRWYAARHGVPHHRSLKIIQWMGYVQQKGWWGEMTKERMQYVGGQEHRFTALQIMDEVQDVDIVTGKEGVGKVLERASERNGEEFYLKSMGDYRSLRWDLPDWTKALPSFVRVLNTRHALATEGRDLKHCVGGYVHAVEEGQCVILAIATQHGRSTVEVNDQLVLMQHRGERNGYPPRRHDQWLRAFLNRHAR